MHQLIDSPSTFVQDLFGRAKHRGELVAAAILLALSGHALASSVVPQAPRRTAEPPTVDLEFISPAPERPPAPPPPDPPRPPVSGTPRADAIARGAAPARAARVVTAPEHAPPEQRAETPIDFVSDPNARVYGAGVVARGGTGASGRPGASTGAVSGSVERAGAGGLGVGGLVPASDLSRPPRLNERDPCRGFFPQNTLEDSARATVLVVVTKSGAVSSVRVIGETPRGQGFGAAARSCMLSKRFEPALDRAGSAAATSLRVNVRFNR
ncbi:MAG TPA: hypothetical protein VIM73_19030 [Polyangiaceae bacterium]